MNPSGIVIWVSFFIGTGKGLINDRKDACEFKDSDSNVAPSQPIVIHKFFQYLGNRSYIPGINLFKTVVWCVFIIHGKMYWKSVRVRAHNLLAVACVGNGEMAVAG